MTWSDTRAARPFAFGIAPVLAVFLCASAWGAPIRQATEAAARAVSLVGFPETAITAVEPRVVSDSLTPFWPVENLSVWEVQFEGVTLSVPQTEGEPKTNPHISKWTLWLDRETGAPVKLASPRPAEGGLESMVNLETKRLAGCPLDSDLAATSELPDRPFCAIAVAGVCQQTLAVTAKEIVAYYGLFTQRWAGETLIAEKPYWFVYYAGVKASFASGGAMAVGGAGPGESREPIYASEAMLVIDAASGEWYWKFLSQGKQ